jgi:MSHA pilin protein MshA
MRKQQGFTLIELVVVIVILGILAVTAAPKFIDLQGDARSATIQGVKAAMESSAALVHSKSLITGNNTVSGVTALAIDASTNINIVNGWPTNSDTSTWDKLLDISDTEFVILSDGTEGQGAARTYIYPIQTTVLSKAAIVAMECYVIYTESASTNTKPEIATFTSGC